MASNPTPDFRAEAVRVALTSGLPRKQVAADFGVGFSTLSRWIQQDRRNPEKPSAQSDLEREVAELRKENRMLREEREVLKKATYYSAGDYAVICREGSSLRSEANEVCFHCKERGHAPCRAAVPDHGCQPTRISRLPQSSAQPEPAKGYGGPRAHSRAVRPVFGQLWQAENDRGTERIGP